jgi:hypothetical protein
MALGSVHGLLALSVLNGCGRARRVMPTDVSAPVSEASPHTNPGAFTLDSKLKVDHAIRSRRISSQEAEPSVVVHQVSTDPRESPPGHRTYRDG